MRAVPREEIVQTVCGSRCDVKCVFVCFLGDACSGDQSGRKIERFACDLHEPELSDDGNTRRSKTGIAALRFAYDNR